MRSSCATHQVFQAAWRKIISKRPGSHLIMLLVVALTVTVSMICGAYVSRENGARNSVGNSNMLEGYYTILLQQPAYNPAPYRHETPYELVAGWREDNIRTSLGTLSVAFLDLTHSISESLPIGVSMISEDVARRFGVAAGDSLTLYESGEAFTLTVSENFQGTIFPELDLAQRVLIHTGEAQHNQILLYQRRPGFEGTERQLLQALKREHGWASVRPAHVPHTFSVLPGYAVAEQIRTMLAVFIFLAVLTAALTAFLDNRRSLSILKALGLASRQVAGFIGLEVALVPLGGIVLGCIFSVATVKVYDLVGPDLELFKVIVGSLLPVVLAVAAAVLIPARLASNATVNQLMFERPIHLFNEKVSALSQHIPSLDAYGERRVKFLKLDVADGYFNGVVLRRLGDMVRVGEVLAVSQAWWGLKITEFVSPQDGTIVFYQEDTGYIGVAATD